MKTAVFTVAGISAQPGEKKEGYLEIPGISEKLPLTVINGSGEGKTVAITGGTHGGEYPGVETSIRLARTLDAQTVCGQVAIVHPVNVPAFFAKLQYQGPYDGLNLNRVYPGAQTGTVSQRIAWAISQNLFTQADFYMDLHGGDLHESLTPFVIYSNLNVSEEKKALAVAGCKAMGIPYVVGSRAAGGAYGCAAQMGVPGFLAEVGELGLWTEEQVALYLRGVKNVLRMLGVLPEPAEDYGRPVLLDHMISMTSDETGCWYPSVEKGGAVKKGQPLGEVRDFFGRTLKSCTAPADGIILYVVRSLAIGAGDPILAIGTDDPDAF